MKSARQGVILEIIAEEDIETQGQLLEALERRGVKSTQATISRDIKELRLIKEVSSEGRYRYAPAGQDEASDEARRMEEIFREGCIGFDHALHTVVIKTLPGLASAVCGAVDAMGEDAVLGTVAGDDTGILIMRNAASAERLCTQLRRAYHR
ncbi:MAG: arginine repressor [Oscillospiraceae bacterium]|nr:arginine repressor [Oscillospiraceae bacterium]MCD7748756.1 arginine repressor [Oscillospiraceae bacterium]